VQETSFQKELCQIMVFLMSIGLTSAWIYNKKCNEDICGKEGSQVAFFQAVAEAMVNCSTKECIAIAIVCFEHR
jgi:sensor histidine kinase regulating citrate/malate metabolism